jgi:hypothetical protein
VGIHLGMDAPAMQLCHHCVPLPFGHFFLLLMSRSRVLIFKITHFYWPGRKTKLNRQIKTVYCLVRLAQHFQEL